MVAADRLAVAHALAAAIDFEQGDKLGHFLAYGIAHVLVLQLYRRLARGLLYGDRVHRDGRRRWSSSQGALGYRTYEVFDMYANTLGVLLGWALALMLPRGLAQA